MPCNQCGDCSYSSASTATLSIVITSGGLAAECQPDQEILHADLAYQSPGVWRRSLASGQTVSVQSLCVSGSWSWSAPVSPPPGGPICLQVGNDTKQVTRNDCGGYEETITTTYPGGGWQKTVVRILIKNNSECE